MRKPLLLLLAIIPVLGGCNAQAPSSAVSDCSAVTQSLVAELPPGAVDLSQEGSSNDAPTPLVIRSVGAYIGAHQVLTIAHAKPRAASMAGMSELKRDDKAHLLLLNTDTCGKPLLLAKNDLVNGSSVRDCVSGTVFGKISGFEDTALTESPLSSFAMPLSGLAVLPGIFQQGDSGRPICDDSGALMGVLAAVRDDAALFIPIQQIRQFLN